MITSRQNQRVKDAAALRNRKARDTRGETLIDGVRETERAVAAGATVRQVFYCTGAGDHDISATLAAAEAAGAELIEVNREVFDKLAYGDRADGVISVVGTRPLGLDDLRLPDNALVAVIERVEKPGNLGAILRTADGAGVDAIVAADPVIDLFNPNVIRASVGTVFKPNVAVASAEETLRWLLSREVRIYAARPDAVIDCFSADHSGAAAIVLGNEAQGLTDLWQNEGVTPVSLPMRGIADSLNVSATAAVVFYEALRQRG